MPQPSGRTLLLLGTALELALALTAMRSPHTLFAVVAAIPLPLILAGASRTGWEGSQSLPLTMIAIVIAASTIVVAAHAIISGH